MTSARHLRWMMCVAAALGSLAPQGWAISLLQNPGFESENPSGYASNWWYYGSSAWAAHRESWANRNPQWGASGNAFNAPGNPYGGFGQDVAVNLSKGDIFTFNISGKAEQNFTNDNTSIGMEFWSGATLRYSITQRVYSALADDRDRWVFFTLVHTNTDSSVNTVKVRCDYGDCAIGGAVPNATCQWDDGRLYQTQSRSSSVPRAAKFEPMSGSYLGVLLDRGGTASEINALNRKAGKRHAVYAKFLLFRQDPFPWDWVNMVKTNCPGAGIHFILEPIVGFEGFFASDWGPGQATYEAAKMFATNCAAAGIPVFLRFGHEMNGDWYPWHPQFSERYKIPDAVSNETYIAGFRNFANLVHTFASNVVMVWGPNQGNGPDPLPFYEDVYPGDDCVDWVGLTVYNGWSYGNSNEVMDFQFRNALQKGYWQENDDHYDDTFEDFYWTFSDPDNPVGHHKPMMISETAAAFEPKYFVTNESLLAGFESLDGPQFTASNTLAEFQSLNSDGFVASNHTWVEGFDSLSTWSWGPWGTNGYVWINSTNCVEGTNALVMSGQPEAGGVYVGGNGRVVGSVPFYPAATIAQFQDLDSDGLVSSNHQWIDAFEVPALWDWGLPWNDLYWSNTANVFQGTNAVIVGPKSSFVSGAYVGGNGRSSVGAGSFIPVIRLAEFQSLNTNASPYKDQDWWPAGSACVPQGDPADGNGGTCTWSVASDPYSTYPTNSLQMSGTDANTNGYIGGNGFTAVGTDRDWSEATHLFFEMRRGNDTKGNPVLRVELNDAGGRTARIDQVVSAAFYDWSEIPLTNMAADSGFAWTNVNQVKLHMLAQTNGIATADLFIKQMRLDHKSVGWDMSAFDGMVFWARRAGLTNRDPLLVLGFRSPLGTATVSKVITSSSWYPIKVPFSEMTASPGFTWADVKAYTIELLSTSDGLPPDSIVIDKWYACRLGSSPNKDQDWGDPGPTHLPWGDAADASGGTCTWSLVVDALAGYPANALKIAGTDRNTNNYVGGSGFFTRPGDRDWSGGSHIALMARQSGNTNKADPLLRLELLDGGARTASASAVVSAALYSRALIARSNMTADVGFSWTNVQQVKLHMLSGTAGVDPNDVYLKDLQVGSVSNTTPVNWSAFNGIELYVKRADDTNVHPILGLNIRSRDTSSNYAASVQRVVTGTAYYPLRIRFSEMAVSGGFQWTNITAFVMEMLSSEAGRTPAELYVDGWKLVNLTNAQYRDQDWWPQGTNDTAWADDTDTNGGWHTWSLVSDPLSGYPGTSLRLSGTDANTNYYIGGNGFSLRDTEKDWSRTTFMTLLARRSDMTNAEPMLAISLRDGTGSHTAQVTQVIVPTNYMTLALAFADMTVTPGFQWTNVASVSFEMLTGTAGRKPADMYLKSFQIGTASNVNEQDWWTAGTGFQPWGDSSWTQTSEAAAGHWGLRISGLITNSEQWYIGGNGCSLAVPRQNWSNFTALIVEAKQGTVTNQVQPKFKLTLDNDYTETNGNEAIIETKVANTNYYTMVMAFDDFRADDGFVWTNVRMIKIELFTGEGGRQPNDLFLDEIRLASITLTNGADNLKWKHDWCNQLYALDNYSDPSHLAHPYQPHEYPDYVSLFEKFRNVHMINWFHVKKFEDGFTKDLRIAEETTGTIAYTSYYERVKNTYFLTNIVVDTDGDGMSDDWELLYFGGITNADGAADRDGDGMKNRDEFLSNSNPTNADAALELDTAAAASVVAGTNCFVIRWQSEPWRAYTLDRTTNLNNGFSVRASGIAATAPLNTYTDSVQSAGPYYYRVRVIP